MISELRFAMGIIVLLFLHSSLWHAFLAYYPSGRHYSFEILTLINYLVFAVDSLNSDLIIVGVSCV